MVCTVISNELASLEKENKKQIKKIFVQGKVFQTFNANVNNSYYHCN